MMIKSNRRLVSESITSLGHRTVLATRSLAPFARMRLIGCVPSHTVSTDLGTDKYGHKKPGHYTVNTADYNIASFDLNITYYKIVL